MGVFIGLRRLFIYDPDPIEEAFLEWKGRWYVKAPVSFFDEVAQELKNGKPKMLQEVENGTSPKGIVYGIVSSVAGGKLKEEYASPLPSPASYRAIYDEALQAMLELGHANKDFVDNQRRYMDGLFASRLHHS